MNEQGARGGGFPFRIEEDERRMDALVNGAGLGLGTVDAIAGSTSTQVSFRCENF